MHLLLAGTGPGTGFPVPGCPCATCATCPVDAPDPGATAGLEHFSGPNRPAGQADSSGLVARRPAELRLGADPEPRWFVDVDGVVHAPDGKVHRLRAGEVLDLPAGREPEARPGAQVGTGGSIEAIGTGDHPVRTVLLIRNALPGQGERSGQGAPQVQGGPPIHAGPTPRDGLGGPVLWAPQSGRLTSGTLQGLAGIELSAVLLGPAPDSDPADPGTDEPPLVECALGLARLRTAGIVLPDTVCVLVGAGHRQGRPDRLAYCLASWGAILPPDGTRLDLALRESPASSSPSTSPGTADRANVRDHGESLGVIMHARTGSGESGDVGFAAISGRTLVIGGSASGKSSLAEHLLAAEPAVVYTATGPVVDLRSTPDTEWAQRVSRHQERRPDWWRTEETHAVAALLARVREPVLLDSIGTWLTGVLDRCGAWHDQPGWRDRLAVETDALVRAWRARRFPLVAVSDEAGLGVVPATASGRLFRDELGRLNRRLADESERVLFVVAGRILSDAP